MGSMITPIWPMGEYPHLADWGGVVVGYPHPPDGVSLIRTGWGYPPVRTGWDTPHSEWMGVPPPPQSGLDGDNPPSWLNGSTPSPRQDWMRGIPHQNWMGVPPVRRQSSRVNTCYAAGGMPLAFTQEEFLVFEKNLMFSLVNLLQS